MSRRPNHSGTLFERKDGTWQGSIQVDSRRKYVYGKTKKEAQDKLDQLHKGVVLAGALPGNQTLTQLLDEWLALGIDGWKPKTRHDYRLTVSFIKQQMGNPRLARLAPIHLQRLYSSLSEKPRKALYVHQVLHRALRLAVMWSWIPQNPADKVIRPAYRKGEKELWTADQCRAFLAEALDNDYWPLFVVALHTGCRMAELTGLRWTDVDLQAGTLRIERTLQRIDRQWVEVAPKTRAGRRLVHMEGQAIAAFRKQKAQQAEWRLKAGAAWNAERALVFCSQTGEPLAEATATHALARLCKRLGLPVLSMHSFRHLHASLALQAGAPLALVSRQLGHANVGITTTIYSHAISDGKMVSEALKRVLEG